MKIYLILLTLISTALYGGSPSNAEDCKLDKQFNDDSQKVEEQESKAKEIADKYNAIFVKPYSKDWSKKYSYELQEAFENKKIIFEATLIDISKINNGYQFQFGHHYHPNSTFLLTSTYDIVNKISKSESKRFIVIATVKSINPLLSNKTGDIPSTVPIDRMSYGQSYLIKGSLDYCINQKSPDADEPPSSQ